jgi:glycosyltransferase involved in cell wall biosynthesis
MKVLMVSPEYPPMKGGVGRYTLNLVNALRSSGHAEVKVASSNDGGGDFSGLSPSNERNSETLLRIVESYEPDVVHLQFEPGLYGLLLDSAAPSKSRTFVDGFYEKSKIPIITTFHSAYTFREWMGQATIVKREGKTGRFGVPARSAIRTWKCFLNYRAFHEINREKLRLGATGVSFSKYMASKVGGGHVIYHGAEPALEMLPSKQDARKAFGLPPDKMIAVALGFSTATKGWDLLGRVSMPEGWVLVTNSSRSHYNKEANVSNTTGIDLQLGFLSEERLSMLLLASDAVMLPYKITSGSGVMFDALAHGLPFVASDLQFFREFADMGLGIVAKRNPDAFSRAIEELGRNYEKYSARVDLFRPKLKWSNVAREHLQLYHLVTKRQRKESQAA